MQFKVFSDFHCDFIFESLSHSEMHSCVSHIQGFSNYISVIDLQLNSNMIREYNLYDFNPLKPGTCFMAQNMPNFVKYVGCSIPLMSFMSSLLIVFYSHTNVVYASSLSVKETC